MDANGKSEPESSASVPYVPLATQLSVYGTGVFSNSMANVIGVVLPLWALQLNATPTMLGIIFASRHVLPLLFSIHGGSLMDRLGTRRVMLITAAIGMVTPLIFPVAPWFIAIILLQMITGLANSMTWIGAQTSVSQVLHGDAVYAGRFSFALRVGLFAGPPLCGYAWDTIGAWGGFGFTSLWASGIVFSALAMGVPPQEQKRLAKFKAPLRFRDLLPKLSDYIETFRLLAIPGMAIIVIVSSLRIGNVTIQDTFFVVLLQKQGLSATAIGLLLSCASVVGAATTLWARWLSLHLNPYWLMVICVIGAIVTMAVTPLVGSFAVLALLACLRGGFMGVTQPLVLTMLSGTVGKDALGKGFGLRTSANRLFSMSMPLAMGAVVELVGLEASFLVMGAVLTAGMIAVAVHIQRRPELGA